MKVHVVTGQFGQDAIHKILENLGGRATANQIAQAVEAAYPDSRLCDTVSIKLNRMRKWGLVEQKYDKASKTWFWLLKQTA